MDVITLTLAAKKALRNLGIDIKTEEKLLLSETEVLYDDANGIVIELEPLEVDKVYNVYWDKQKYSCVCKRKFFDEMEFYTLGNLSFLGEENTNEPFVILSLPEKGLTDIVPALDENNHIISIYEYIEDIQPINKKFMPNEYIEGITDSKIETLIKNKQIGSIDDRDILWDGDTTDRETIIEGFYRVSDRAFTADEVKGYRMVFSTGPVWDVYEDRVIITMEDGTVIERDNAWLGVRQNSEFVTLSMETNGSGPGSTMVISIPNDTTLLPELGLEKGGTFCVSAEELYVSRIYLKETVHKIDDKFLSLIDVAASGRMGGEAPGYSKTYLADEFYFPDSCTEIADLGIFYKLSNKAIKLDNLSSMVIYIDNAIADGVQDGSFRIETVDNSVSGVNITTQAVIRNQDNVFMAFSTTDDIVEGDAILPAGLWIRVTDILGEAEPGTSCFQKVVFEFKPVIYTIAPKYLPSACLPLIMLETIPGLTGAVPLNDRESAQVAAAIANSEIAVFTLSIGRDIPKPVLCYRFQIGEDYYFVGEFSDYGTYIDGTALVALYNLIVGYADGAWGATMIAID